jgi:hypothetical protein
MVSKKTRKSRKLKGGVKWCEGKKMFNKQYEGEKTYNKRTFCILGETAIDCNDGITPENNTLLSYYNSGDCRVIGGKKNKSKRKNK